jgi:hypothetical protein
VFHQVLVISTMLGLVANFAGGWIARAGRSSGSWTGYGDARRRAACRCLCCSYARGLVRRGDGHFGRRSYVVFFSVWGQVYGRSHLGKIQGCAQMMTVFASAVGPLLLAETLARTGSYNGIFYGLAAIVAVLGVGSWWVRLPARS